MVQEITAAEYALGANELFKQNRFHLGTQKIVFSQSYKVETPIDISDCTIAFDGLSFVISGAADDEAYEYIYEYINLSTTPSLSYNYPTNIAGQSKDNSRDIGLLDAKINKINAANKLRLDALQRQIDDILATP